MKQKFAIEVEVDTEFSGSIARIKQALSNHTYDIHQFVGSAVPNYKIELVEIATGRDNQESFTVLSGFSRG